MIDSIEQGVPAPVITMAMAARFASQGKADYGNRMLAMMRNAFGGHAVKDASRGGRTVSRDDGPGPCHFVIFGATGHLSRTKLLPALYHLHSARAPEREHGYRRHGAPRVVDRAMVRTHAGMAARRGHYG